MIWNTLEFNKVGNESLKIPFNANRLQLWTSERDFRSKVWDRWYRISMSGFIAVVAYGFLFLNLYK